jgi:hypothetical protein
MVERVLIFAMIWMVSDCVAKEEAQEDTAVALLRAGFQKQNAELRAGALLIEEGQNTERWTFEAEGITLHLRTGVKMDSAKIAQENLKKTATACFSQRDREALDGAVSAPFLDDAAHKPLSWIKGEHFEFRAQLTRDTFLVLNTRCLSENFTEKLRKEFSAELAANEKYRSKSYVKPPSDDEDGLMDGNLDRKKRPFPPVPPKQKKEADK